MDSGSCTAGAAAGAVPCAGVFTAAGTGAFSGCSAGVDTTTGSMVGIALAGGCWLIGTGAGAEDGWTRTLAKGSPSSSITLTAGSAVPDCATTCAGVFCLSDLCRKKLVKPVFSGLGAGAFTGSSTGISIRGRALSAGMAATVSRGRFGSLTGFSGSGSSSYLGRSRCFSIKAPTVSRSATISSTTNSTVKMIIDAILENTATAPWPKAPEITPPHFKATPSFHMAGMIPIEEAYASFTSSMWHNVPSSTGSSSALVTRKVTGRP